MRMNILCVFAVHSIVSHVSNVNAVLGMNDNDNECKLYLAPSYESNEDVITLGMFAGVDLPEKSIIGIPELAIPLIDMDLHNGMPKGYVKPHYFKNQLDFFWNPSTVGATYEIHTYPDESDEVKSGGSGLLVAIPGVGSLTAEHNSISNAALDSAAVLRRTNANRSTDANTNANADMDSNSHDNNDDARKSHPGRGAYTHYYNVTLKTTKLIPTGMQIFQDAGSQYDYTSDTQTLKPIDYQDVDHLLQKIITFIDKHAPANTPNTRTAQTAQHRNQLYNFFINDVLSIVGTQGWNEDIDRSDNDDFKTAILKLFPDSPDHIPHILERGGTFEANHPELIRDIAWLQKNGQCLDTIYSDQSTLDYAGQGAFATRDIPNGDLVAPVPLFIIDRKEWLNMYGTKLYPSINDARKFAKRATGNKVLHQQMLLNYSFGHPHSTLLLFSYGMGVNFINHGPTHIPENATNNSNANANAKIVWTKQSYNIHELQNIPLKELLKTDNAHRNLGFDIVATRTIQAHEEILIDYGTEWTQAWKSHVQNNKLPQFWPTRALDINTASAAGNDMIYTLAEREHMVQDGEQDPYDDSYVMTACHFAKEKIAEDDDTPRTVDDLLVYRFPEDEDLTQMVKNLHRCTVLERHPPLLNGDGGVYSYTVFFLPENEEGDIIVKGVPREAIIFVDQPYESDLHTPKTFRHPIGIPDSIFPDAWRDLK